MSIFLIRNNTKYPTLDDQMLFGAKSVEKRGKN